MKIALALDNFGPSSEDSIDSFAAACVPYIDTVKIGLELFTRFGPAALKFANGKEIFLDLKLHDIPRTVGNVVREINRFGVHYLTIHANENNIEMVKEALKEVRPPTKILVVSLLTSSETKDVSSVISLCANSGVTGFVSPVRMVKEIKAKVPNAFVVTPGIRIESQPFKNDDQKAVASPEEALVAGSDMIVVGRAVNISPEPTKVLESLQKFRNV